MNKNSYFATGYLLYWRVLQFDLLSNCNVFKIYAVMRILIYVVFATLFVFSPKHLCYAINKAPVNNVLIQDKKNLNFVSSDSIRTVQLYPVGFELADPVIELSRANHLLFSFDQLGDSPDFYTYTIVHCDSDWNESGLYYSDYMDGFQQNTLNSYRSSFNTKEAYAHYELELPNDQVSMKLSGNYLIRVYGSASASEPVIQRRFMVVEQAVTIKLVARQSTDPKLIMTHQQLDCQVLYNDLPVNDPFSELRMVVDQDGVPNNLKPQPQYNRPNSADYSGIDRLVFDGLNEWRSFDTRSIRYNSINVDEIKLAGEHYHVLLKQDFSRANAKYVSQPDFNGRTAIQGEKDYDAGIELEYPIIYFTLQTPELEGEDVFVVGDFTGFAYTDTYKMIYNNERNAYELGLPLKQGFYNYMYAVKGKNANEASLSTMEGSHSETENSYSVYVYYRQPGARYERLVGYARVN